ncbi:phospholipase D-like domain-containing protein [Cryobacterium sp. GrIS_2_6]|uniref:phospholipase D-like domain-containing protein n=1 Tax=Cryobacterium sp. GrIS_2_6 TaxID=3162785 RepID=UPI002E096D12|nr:phosphatidylserine/phosphatidylglycerophosphate/cardiolipin synthase-like enzyme [Cryobacterium psychrotolerans]
MVLATPSAPFTVLGATLISAGLTGSIGQSLLLPQPTGPIFIFIFNVVGAGPADARDSDLLRDVAATFARAAQRYPRIALAIGDTFPLDAATVGQVVVEGVLLACYRYVELQPSSHHCGLVSLDIVGLDVELFVSAVGDQALVYNAQRSYYEALLRAGVSIYLYRAPTVLYTKHFTIDDDIAVIGSSKRDIRSFSLNREISVLVHGRDFTTGMRRVEDGYRANSVRRELADWLAGGSPRRSMASWHDLPPHCSEQSATR